MGDMVMRKPPKAISDWAASTQAARSKAAAQASAATDAANDAVVDRAANKYKWTGAQRQALKSKGSN